MFSFYVYSDRLTNAQIHTLKHSGTQTKIKFFEIPISVGLLILQSYNIIKALAGPKK